MKPSKLFNKVFKKRLLKEFEKVKKEIMEENYAYFNMSHWNQLAKYVEGYDDGGKCGSVRCIGGSLQHVSGEDNVYHAFSRKHKGRESARLLARLFYPAGTKAWQDYMGTTDPDEIYAASKEDACYMIDRFITH